MAFEARRDPAFLQERQDFLRKIKEEAETGGKDFLFREKIPQFKGKDGENTVRFLEGSWPGAKHYGIDLFVHYGVGPGRGQFLCLDKLGPILAILTHKIEPPKGPCPVCEEHRRALTRQEADYAKDIRAQHKVLAYVIDRSAPAQGPLAWTMPFSKIAKSLVSIQYNRRTNEYLFIDDRDKGRDVTFTKKGQNLNTDYFGIHLDPDPSRLSDSVEEMEGWLKYIQAHPLPDMLLFRDADYIKQVLYGSTGGADTAPSGMIMSEATRRAVRTVETPTTAVVAPAEATTMFASAPTPPPITSVGEAVMPDTGGLTIKKIKEMTRPQLCEVIAARGLVDIDPTMYTEDEDLITAVLLSLGMES